MQKYHEGILITGPEGYIAAIGKALALIDSARTAGMDVTADIYPFDAHFLAGVATRIVNEVQGINRVVYDYTSKPPGTIEWE